jgi:hypothetical protein
MANFGRGYTYLIAAQFQALALLAFAYFAGSWLNDHWPKGFNWYAVTIPISVLGMAQTFYVVVRQVMSEGKTGASGKTDTTASKKS